MLRLYRAIHFGEPVGGPRPELGELLPVHAECLRYDLGFHKPGNQSLVVFPVFKHAKNGGTQKSITLDKWRSHGVKLEQVPFDSAEGGDILPEHTREWITYRHPLDSQGRPEYSKLVPVTMAEYMRSGKFKLAVRHR